MSRSAVTILLALSVAAVLGASLGLAAAGTRKDALVAGVNPTVGGPLGSDLTPLKFMSCLPQGSWSGLYIWDGEGTNQRWLHFFNADLPGVPGYVNDPSVNGITKVRRYQGVALVMISGVESPFFPDRETDGCPAP